jgi:hypothetical protein
MKFHVLNPISQSMPSLSREMLALATPFLCLTATVTSAVGLEIVDFGPELSMVAEGRCQLTDGIRRWKQDGLGHGLET